VGLAGLFLSRTQQDVANRTTALRAFDGQAREVVDALADLRFGQEAYVAAGQSTDQWAPKVAATSSTIRTTLVSLRQTAASPPARSALMEAEAVVAEFDAIDKRARDYVASGDQLMAADVIFTEGHQTAGIASRQVETARLAEHQALDAHAAFIRSRQAIVLVAAAGFGALIILFLALAPRGTAAVRESEGGPRLSEGAGLSIVPPSPVPEEKVVVSRTPGLLKSAAELCTDFGRVRDLSDLRSLLEKAAKAMDASGVVVWLGSTSGADLQPIVSHGYSPQVIAKMPSVPRSANNAAAAAYRTGTLQIVLARPGGSTGALVAPLLAPEGCIGAFSAEVRNGGEGSESSQALAAIFAAHLAGIFAVAASDANEPKAASAT
jgi:hypothetical protein